MFDQLHTLSPVRRSTYNQYDSAIRPIQNWVTSQGVHPGWGGSHRHRLRRLAGPAGVQDPPRTRRRTVRGHRPRPRRLRVHLNGSMTSDTTYGDSSTVAPLIRDKRDGSWRLWEKRAKKADGFGRPTAFSGNIDETKWEYFTLTMTNRTLHSRTQRTRTRTGLRRVRRVGSRMGSDDGAEAARGRRSRTLRSAAPEGLRAVTWPGACAISVARQGTY